MLRVYYLSIQKKVGSAVQNVSSLSQSIGMVNQDIRYQWKEARIRIEEALGSCILPSLQLIPANPAIGQEIWELLRLLPYEVCLNFEPNSLTRFLDFYPVFLLMHVHKFMTGSIPFIWRMGKRR